jgi:hypothetical protein
MANGKRLGGLLNDPGAINTAQGELARALGINCVAKLMGLSKGTVQRIEPGIEAA